MKKRLVAVLLCVAMLFSFAAMTAAASETTTEAAAETETEMVAPANFIQFIMAIFVRLFEMVAGLFS